MLSDPDSITDGPDRILSTLRHGFFPESRSASPYNNASFARSTTGIKDTGRPSVIRMSMPADMGHFLDTQDTRPDVFTANEDSMLQMLLRSLPEPPASSSIASVTALADSLPQPPTSPLSPSSSGCSTPSTDTLDVLYSKPLLDTPFLNNLPLLDTPAPSQSTEAEHQQLRSIPSMDTLSSKPTVVDSKPSVGVGNRATWCAPARAEQCREGGPRRASVGEWLGDQKPPKSPHFDEGSSYVTALGRKAAADPRLPAPQGSGRLGWFRIDVLGAFEPSSGARPKAIVEDLLNGSTNPTSALSGHKSLSRLLLGNKPVPTTQTGIRQPSTLHRAHTVHRRCRPVVSFQTSGTNMVEDVPARSVDIERMVAAYLPHVYSEFQKQQACPTADATTTPPVMEPKQADKTPPPCLNSTTSSANRLSAVEGSGIRPPRRLERLSSTISTVLEPRLFAPRLQPVRPITRRQSEVQALITQANAVLGTGLRTADPPRSRLRPPRSSLPLTLGGSLTLSPRSSLLGSPTRTPTDQGSSLMAALSRQHHRLDSARECSGEISPLSLTPVRSLSFVSNRAATGLRAPNSCPAVQSSSRIPMGRRPPSGQLNNMPARASVQPQGMRRLAAAGRSKSLAHTDVHHTGRPVEEFLTLRPVHTPDLVPRTIDPRLVERAMTPMLKHNMGSLNMAVNRVNRVSSESADLGSQMLRHVGALSMAREPSADLESRLSPLNSPEPRRSFGSGRFTLPTSLFSRSKKQPLLVSAIPMPPSGSKPMSPLKAGLSNIPSLSKAKSIWSLKGRR
ncbi:hypothetical protein GGI25_005117 [Coemansia spiralis]|uniref:Uncharacterized protein n=2 Tax=Coemansia TaxID=4863 RepID=A0A9W8FZ60_9FUNG|nr:hypothetical protein EDC05_005529 [Coemansia umbellata]KAJ2619981.1 hypothetical protein GGI26_005379 [Coemansia sp. RSA 1358]KAJ2672408.1 hypothetical protein GGI25_005117 [Coemansia spiralis]